MQVRVVESHSANPDAAAAAREIANQVRTGRGGDPLRGAFLYTRAGYDVDALLHHLRQELGPVPIVGSTSCLGVGGALTNGEASAVGGLWLAGADVSFGAAQVGGGAREAGGARLAREALAAAALSPERVAFAILHSTPGDEESLLRGIYEVLPKRTPLIGGSAADDDLSGKWRIWGGGSPVGEGAALAVCEWPGRFGVAFRGGYLVTGRSGVVTRASGRVLYEIDGKPAAEVYDEWCGGRFKAEVEKGETLLDKTTLWPLGLARRIHGGIDTHLLVHPERVLLPDRALQLFASVRTGDEVKLMHSTPEALVHRPADVAQEALRLSRLRRDEIIGSLMVYCGGCLLAIRDQAGEMVRNYREAVGSLPSVATFSFGEQGCVLQEDCEHGNLMASVLMLSDRPRAS